jgi:hypothetical protein
MIELHQSPYVYKNSNLVCLTLKYSVVCFLHNHLTIRTFLDFSQPLDDGLWPEIKHGDQKAH